MKESDVRIFASLFREAYRKCFSHELTTPLTESESNHFSNEIFENTGLVIGWKSLKNYAHFILAQPRGKPENPSTPTLDTLARYVAEAPVTDEVQRKKRESHYPYWFRYKESFYQSHPQEATQPVKDTPPKQPVVPLAVWGGAGLVALLCLVLLFREKTKVETFTDEFDAVTEDALASRGWFLKSRDAGYWARRDEQPGHLTLFTLSGDNWPDSGRVVHIKNLLLREVPHPCFVTEIQLSAFFPKQNWQQAGILLLEDTSFVGKSLRMSIGYNDFSGGFAKTREIIIQAITSLGSDFRKPEEIAHHQIFVVEQDADSLIAANLENAALRIEKRGNRFRLLYSNGQLKNAAFKEVVSTAFDMQPRYIGLFALKGFVSNADDLPASFDAFHLADYPCDNE